MSKFDPSDHIRKHPEIATKENTTLIEEVVSEAWKTMSTAMRDSRRLEIARNLKLPQEARVNRGILSRTIINTSHLIRLCILIKEKGLEPGKRVKLKFQPNSPIFTISRVSPRFTIYLKEMRGEYNPSSIEPE